MSDALINPVTRDYVMAAGSPGRDPAGGLANAVYLRLMTPLGSYWAEPLLGSKLHLLQRTKDLARVERLAKQYAEQALAAILADGRASAVEVSTQRIKVGDGSGRLSLLIEVTAASGERMTFTHPVKVL
jgi:phage gp46-like protein